MGLYSIQRARERLTWKSAVLFTYLVCLFIYFRESKSECWMLLSHFCPGSLIHKIHHCTAAIFFHTLTVRNNLWKFVCILLFHLFSSKFFTGIRIPVIGQYSIHWECCIPLMSHTYMLPLKRIHIICSSNSAIEGTVDSALVLCSFTVKNCTKEKWMTPKEAH